MTRGTLKASNNEAIVTLLSVKLSFPGCSSLKEKRRRLQPLLARLRSEYNACFAETGLQDYWQSGWISCALVSNDGQYNVKVANEIIHHLETHFPDELIDEHHIESR